MSRLTLDMRLQELKASFYSNSSLLSSDLQLLSKKNAFNDMLTVGLLNSHVDIYAVHRYAVRLIALLFLFFCINSNGSTTDSFCSHSHGQPE